MDVPRIPLKTNPQEERSFQDYKSQDPLVSSSEAVDASIDLAQEETGAGLLSRYLGTRELENTGVSNISADEANKRFPGMRTPFREDINPYVAQMHYDDERRKAELEYKISKGPSDAFTRTKMMGAGLVAHMMDPIEFGAGAFLGMGAGWAIGKGALGSQLAGASRALLAGGEAAAAVPLSQRLAVATAESLSGNLVQNVGQEIASKAVTVKQGGSYDPELGTILEDIAVNTFAASALHIGIKEGANSLNAFKRILQKTSPEADKLIAQTVIGNMKNDIRPDVTPILETLARETDVNPGKFGLKPYMYEPISSVEGKRLYVATRDAVSDFRTGDRAVLGDDYGMGTHVTDNPGVANAAASRVLSDSTGAVHEVTLSDFKPLNIEDKIPENLKPLFVEELGFPESMKVSEALAFVQRGIDDGSLPPHMLDSIKQEIQSQGYNSLLSDGKSNFGVENGQPHNHITVLDDNLIKQVAAHEPDPAVVNSPRPEVLSDAAARGEDFRNNSLVDAKSYEQFSKELEAIPAGRKVDAVKIKDELAGSVEDITALKDQNLLSPNELKEFDSIKEMIKDSEKRATLIKAAAYCLGL